MFDVDIDSTVILQQQKNLEAALSTNPDTEKALCKLIRKEILAARAQVVGKIAGDLHSDPRGAAQSVRTVVYKKVLGANINIYHNRKAHGHTNYEPPRTLNPSKPGGNRRKRNSRTQQIMSYGPLDRGFILQFVNGGTVQRNIEYRTTCGLKGNRGSIPRHNFFASASRPALAQAADNLSRLIETELASIMNNKKK